MLEPRRRGVLDAPHETGHDSRIDSGQRAGSRRHLHFHRMHRAETDRDPVPGVDGADQHGQIDQLAVRELGMHRFVVGVRRMRFETSVNASVQASAARSRSL